MKVQTDDQKKLTENFLKYIYSKNEAEFNKVINTEADKISFNQFFKTTLGGLLMTSLAF